MMGGNGKVWKKVSQDFLKELVQISHRTLLPGLGTIGENCFEAHRVKKNLKIRMKWCQTFCEYLWIFLIRKWWWEHLDIKITFERMLKLAACYQNIPSPITWRHKCFRIILGSTVEISISWWLVHSPASCTEL